MGCFLSLYMTPYQKFLNFVAKVVGVWFIIGGFGIAAWAFLQGFSQAGGFDAITSIMVASGLIPCILGVLLIKAKGFGANDNDA
jgi:hypothetical protein